MPSTETLARDTNADNELARRVYNSLLSLGYRQHIGVHCNANGSTVTLHGELPSYFLTQSAQAIAMKVPGVRELRNEIVVCEATS